MESVKFETLRKYGPGPEPTCVKYVFVFCVRGGGGMHETGFAWGVLGTCLIVLEMSANLWTGLTLFLSVKVTKNIENKIHNFIEENLRNLFVFY